MGRDRIAREIMVATGACYTTALRERDDRWTARQLDSYLLAVRALPPRLDGDPERCVTCLIPLDAARRHNCPVRAKR